MADFWAGYISGAVGILVGNPLDLIKTKLQAGPPPPTTQPTALPTAPLPATQPTTFKTWTSLARGAAAPILGYGALNALLFVTYNRSLSYLNTGAFSTPPNPYPATPAWTIWTAGALGGLATFVVSAPTELVKCRAQVSDPPRSSAQVVRELWKGEGGRRGGVRGLYMGGAVTSVRDAVGYGFYFWSYEVSKSLVMSDADSPEQHGLKIMLCGGLAGVATWVSIFPLDVIKTRVQTFDLVKLHHEQIEPVRQPLLAEESIAKNTSHMKRPSSFAIARQAYRTEGVGVFFRGIGVCSTRAFVVNAVQWAIYEWIMKALTS